MIPSSRQDENPRDHKTRRFVFGSMVAPLCIEMFGEFVEFVPQKWGNKLYKTRNQSKVAIEALEPGIPMDPLL
jgi:hypothetical protein